MAERNTSSCNTEEEEMPSLAKKNSSSSSSSSSRQEDARLPVDKGYAWIVCLATFSIMLVLMGTVRCFGIYLHELQKIFDTSSAMISTLLGVEYFANCIAAFIVLNCLATICSCRVLVTIGCILCSICFILDAFANNVIMLPFFHVINGAGISFMFGPSIVIIGHYFKKYRGTANALTSCGSSVGQFMLSPIISLLVSTYGIKGALLINAGLFVQCIVFAMLLRPISFYTSSHDARKIYDSTANENGEEAEHLLIKIEDMAVKKDLLNKGDNLEIKYVDQLKKRDLVIKRDLVVQTDDLVIKSKDQLNKTDHVIKHEGLVIQTDDLVVQVDTNDVRKIYDSTANENGEETENLLIKIEDMGVKKDLRNKGYDLDQLKKRDLVIKDKDLEIKTGDLVVQTDDLAIKSEDQLKKRDLVIKDKDLEIKKGDLVIQVDNLVANKKDTLNQTPDLTIKNEHLVMQKTSTEMETLKQSSLSEEPIKRCETNNSTNHENKSNTIHSEEKKTSSLINLNSAKKNDVQTTSGSKPFQNDAINPETVSMKSVVEKKAETSPLYKRMFAEISLNLFRQKIFVVLFFGCTMATVSTSVPQTYFPAYSEDIGLGITKGAYFVSMAGFADLGGRVLTTILVDWKYLNRTGFLAVTLVIQGVIGCFSPFYTSFLGFACYCVSYGITSGVYFAISITILTDLIGLEKLSQSLGLILLFVGIIATAIFPAYGFLRDVTGSYHVVFILNSVGLIISGILFWSTSWVPRNN